MRFLFMLLFIALVVHCSDKGVPRKSQPTEPDAYTFATPGGSELLPAERGPVRDVFEPPPVNLDRFQLLIDGEVNAPKSLSWNELQDLNAVQTDTMFMYCVEGWEVWGVWRGILIKDLISLAEPKEIGTYIMFHGLDGYRTALPLAYLLKYNAMLAYQVNGLGLRKHDGYPLRLVAFGLFGYKWAKYVTRLELINGPQLGFWERYGYDDRAIVPLERRRFYEGDDAQAIEF